MPFRFDYPAALGIPEQVTTLLTKFQTYLGWKWMKKNEKTCTRQRSWGRPHACKRTWSSSANSGWKVAHFQLSLDADWRLKSAKLDWKVLARVPCVKNVILAKKFLLYFLEAFTEKNWLLKSDRRKNQNWERNRLLIKVCLIYVVHGIHYPS